jgi:Rrf2 family protein
MSVSCEKRAIEAESYCQRAIVSSFLPTQADFWDLPPVSAALVTSDDTLDNPLARFNSDGKTLATSVALWIIIRASSWVFSTPVHLDTRTDVWVVTEPLGVGYLGKELKMRISRSTGYALLATCYIAKHSDKTIVSSQTISRQYEIPLEYLLKILQQLVRGNILRSKRGPHGGFSLARPAKKITVLQVIEAVDGPMVSQLRLAEQTQQSKLSVRIDKTFDRAIAQARAVFHKMKLSNLVEA